MSATPIKDVKTSFFANVGAVGKSQSINGTSDFSQVFNKTQGQSSQGPEKDSDVKNLNHKSEGSDDVKAAMKVNDKVKTEQVKDASENFEKASGKEAENLVAETGEQMKEKVAETLDISEEEVEAVLEMMGLSPLDLLNPDNLTKVVLELNPGTDALSLMTNEELFSSLKSLMVTAEDLLNQIKEQLQLSGDTKEVLSYLKDSMFQMSINNAAKDETLDTQMQMPEVMAEDETDIQVSKLRIDGMEDVTAAKDTSLEASAALKVETVQEGRDQYG